MSIEPLSWGRGSTLNDVELQTDTAVQTEHQRWSVPARSANLEAVRAALTSKDSLGVIITGGRGVGKSSLARTAVSELGPDVWALQLRSGHPASKTPYGCLSFLLARLPQAYMGSPTAILRGITSLIRSDAAGRPCVITLDTAGSIDDMSAGVLLNVLLTGTARIVAVAPRSSDLPADFHWLLTERRLTEVRLDNLNELQTRQVLLTMLGHRVSASLVSIYHSMVGGNPLLLKALVTEQQLSGNLVLSDSVWTLRDKVVLDGAASLDDIVRSRWARKTPETRDVIEMLSCARSVDLSRLTSIFGAGIVADMEDAGLLDIDGSDSRWVSLREKYLGDVVRSWLSIARRRELRAQLLDGKEPDPASMTVEELMAFAAWTRECEAELSPAMALAAAEASVQLFDPHSALTYAETLTRNDPQWVSGQRQKAAAYLLLDLPIQAMAALDDITRPQLDGLDADEYAQVVAAKSTVMVWLPELTARVPEMLEEARTRLGVGPELAKGWPAPLAVAANRISLSEFEYKAFVGDFASMIPALEAASNAARNPDVSFRMKAAIILMTALSLTGREMDALSLMRTLGGQISDAAQIVGLREEYTSRAYAVLLTAGQWRRCIDLLDPPESRDAHRLPYRSAATELAAGIAYVYSGRGAAALDPLLSAAAQLELRPVQSSLRSAYAATALAYAQIGNAGQSRRYLEKVQRSAGPCDFLTGSIIEFCADMAGRWLGENDAVSRLKDSARRNIDAGRFTVAGISLLGATVNGTEADFRLLEQVAGQRQGPLAEIARLIAVGSRTKDAKTLRRRRAGGHAGTGRGRSPVHGACRGLRPAGR